MIPQIQPLRPLQPLKPYGYIKRPRSYNYPQDSYIADRNNPYSVDSVGDVLFNVEGIKRVAASVEGYDSRDWGFLAPLTDRVVAAVSSLNQYYIKPVFSGDLDTFQKSMVILSNSLNNMSETIDSITGSNLVKGAIRETGLEDLTNTLGGLAATAVTVGMLALSAKVTGGLTLGLAFKALMGGQVAYGTTSLLTAASIDPDGAARGIVKASGLSSMGRTQYDMEYKNWFNRIYAEMALDPVNWLSFSGTILNSFSKDLGYDISNSALSLGAKFAELDKSLMRFAYNTDPLVGALRGSVRLVKHAKNLRTKQMIKLAEQFVSSPKSLTEGQTTKLYNYMKKPFEKMNGVRKHYRRTDYLEHIRGSDELINRGVADLYVDLGVAYNTIDASQKAMYSDRYDFIRSRLKTILNDIVSGAFLNFRDVADDSAEQISLALSRYFAGQGLDARKYFELVKAFNLDYSKMRDVGLYDLDPFRKPIEEYTSSLIEDSEVYAFVTNAHYDDLNNINKEVATKLKNVRKSDNFFAEGVKALRQTLFERYSFLQKYLVSNRLPSGTEVVTQFDFNAFKKAYEGSGLYDVFEGMARRYGVTLEEVFGSLDRYTAPSSFDEAVKGLDFTAASLAPPKKEASAVLKRILPDDIKTDSLLDTEISQRSMLSKRLDLFLDNVNSTGSRYGSITLTPMFQEITKQVYTALFEGSDDVSRWAERFTKSHPQMAQLLTQMGDVGDDRMGHLLQKLHDYVPALDTFDDANIKALISGFYKLTTIYGEYGSAIAGDAPYSFGGEALDAFTAAMRAANSMSPETMSKLLDGLYLYTKDNPDNTEASFFLDLFKNYPQYKPAFGAEERAAFNVMDTNKDAVVLKLSYFMESIINLQAVQQDGMAMELLKTLTDDKNTISQLLKIVQQNMEDSPEFFELFQRATRIMRAAKGTQNFANFLTILHDLPGTTVFYNTDTKVLTSMKMPAGVKVLPGGTLIIDPISTAGYDFAIDLAEVDFLHSHFKPFEINEVKAQYLMDVNSTFDYEHNEYLRTKGPDIEPITEATIKPTVMYHDLLKDRKARLEARFEGFFPKKADGSYDLANVILTPEQATELANILNEIQADPDLKEFFDGLNYFESILQEVRKNAWELRRSYASELHELTRSVTNAKSQIIAYNTLKNDHAPFIRAGLYSFDSAKALQTVKTNINNEINMLPKGVDYFTPSQVTAGHIFSGKLSYGAGFYDSFYGRRFKFNRSTYIPEGNNLPTRVDRTLPLVSDDIIRKVYDGEPFKALELRPVSAEEFAVYDIAKKLAAEVYEFLHPDLKRYLRYVGITDKNIDAARTSILARAKDRSIPLNAEANHYLVGVYHYLQEFFTDDKPIDIKALLIDPEAQGKVSFEIARLTNQIKTLQKSVIDPKLPLEERNALSAQKAKEIADLQRELDPLLQKYAYDIKIAPWLKRYEEIKTLLKSPDLDDSKRILLEGERDDLYSKLSYGESHSQRAKPGSFLQNYPYLESEAQKQANFAIMRYITDNPQVRRAIFADLNTSLYSPDTRMQKIAQHLMALYPQHKIYLGENLAESFPMDAIEFDNARVVNKDTIDYFVNIVERDQSFLKTVTYVVTNPMAGWSENPSAAEWVPTEQKVMRQVHAIMRRMEKRGATPFQFRIIGPDGRVFNNDGSMYPDFEFPQTDPSAYDRSKETIKQKVSKNSSAYASFNSVIKYARRAARSNDPMQDGNMLRHYVNKKGDIVEVKDNPIPHLMRASDVGYTERLNISFTETDTKSLILKARLVENYVDASALNLPLYTPSDVVSFEVGKSLFSRIMPAYWASLLNPDLDVDAINQLSKLDQMNDEKGLSAFYEGYLKNKFLRVPDDTKLKAMRSVLRQLFNEVGIPSEFENVDFINTPVISLDETLGDFWSAATPEGENNLGFVITQLFRELNEIPHGGSVVFRNPHFKPGKDTIIDASRMVAHSYKDGEYHTTPLKPKEFLTMVDKADQSVDRLIYITNVTAEHLSGLKYEIADNVILPKSLRDLKNFAYPSREAFAQDRLADHVARYGLVRQSHRGNTYYTLAPHRMVSRKISGHKLAAKQYEFGLIPSLDTYLQEKGMVDLSGNLLVDIETYLLEEEAYLKKYPSSNPIHKVWETLHATTGYTPEDIFLIKVRPNRTKFTEHSLIMISDYAKIYELRRGGFKIFTKAQLDALNNAVRDGADAHTLFKNHTPDAKVLKAIEEGVTVESVPEVNKLEKARQKYWTASAKVKNFITTSMREQAKAHILIKGSTVIDGTDKTYFEALAEKLSEYGTRRLEGRYSNSDSTIDFREIKDINDIIQDVRKLLVQSYGSPFDDTELKDIEDLEWLVNSLIADGVSNNFVDNYTERVMEDAVGALTPEMKELVKIISENDGETIKNELKSFIVDLAKQINVLKIELNNYEAIRPRPFGEDTVLYYDSEGSVNRARARVRAVLDDLRSLVNTKAALSKGQDTILSEMQRVTLREFKEAKEEFYGMYSTIELSPFLDGPVYSGDDSNLFSVSSPQAFREGEYKRVQLNEKISAFNAPHNVKARLDGRETAYQAKLSNTKIPKSVIDRYNTSTSVPIGLSEVSKKARPIAPPKYTQAVDSIPDFTDEGKAKPFDIVKDMHEYVHDQKKALMDLLKKYSFLQEHYDFLTQAGVDEAAKLQYLLSQAAKFTDDAAESDFNKVVAGHHIYSEPIPGFPIEFKWNEHLDLSSVGGDVEFQNVNAFNPKNLTVISGGQAGADIGGLLSARRYGFVTGGKAPKGFWSEPGGVATPELLKELGLEEDTSGLRLGEALVERSKKNVDSADGTIAFLPPGKSVGTSKTIGYAQTGMWRHYIPDYAGDVYKPHVVVKWDDPIEYAVESIVNFLKDNNVKTLNIAGSRESVIPGMQKRTEEIMDSVFAQLHAEFGLEKPVKSVVGDALPAQKNADVINVNKAGPSVFDTPGAHYIGRKNSRIGQPESKLGNPFVIGKDGTREEVIIKYEEWLQKQLKDPTSDASIEFKMLKERYESGQPLHLVCFCAPLPCHGDVIMKLLKNGTPATQPLSIDDVVAIMKKAPKINKTKKGVKQKEFEQLSFADIMEEEKE